MVSSPERPLPEDELITGMGLLVTTTVGCLVLLSLVFQWSYLMPAGGVVLAGLIVGTSVGAICRRQEARVRPARKLSSQTPPRELAWNAWLDAAQRQADWR